MDHHSVAHIYPHMGSSRRIIGSLEKARKKRTEWDAKVKDLERRYREEENTEIHEMVHAANLTPEQLAELRHSCRR